MQSAGPILEPFMLDPFHLAQPKIEKKPSVCNRRFSERCCWKMQVLAEKQVVMPAASWLGPWRAGGEHDVGLGLGIYLSLLLLPTPHGCSVRNPELTVSLASLRIHSLVYFNCWHREKGQKAWSMQGWRKTWRADKRTLSWYGRALEVMTSLVKSDASLFHSEGLSVVGGCAQ